MTDQISSIAFIPARSGSKRIPGKNIQPLGEHPMLAYSIRAAIDSGVFDSVVCATDDQHYADIALHYGAEVPFLRSKVISGDTSPDIDWVVWALNRLKAQGRHFDAFSILRPTSPFRLPETIRRAWNIFIKDGKADSLRAVEKCKQHPGKMWLIRKNRMLPLLPFSNGSTPWHSSQYGSLPEVFAQDASLEMAWSRVPLENASIAGESIIPFVSRGYEGFDINDQQDLWIAEYLLKEGLVKLPTVSIPRFAP